MADDFPTDLAGIPRWTTTASLPVILGRRGDCYPNTDPRRASDFRKALEELSAFRAEVLAARSLPRGRPPRGSSKIPSWTVKP